MEVAAVVTGAPSDQALVVVAARRCAVVLRLPHPPVPVVVPPTFPLAAQAQA